MANFRLGATASARGYRLHGYDTVGSTNSEAVRAAQAGDAGNAWFATLQQTEGRGRRGRSWETPAGNLGASLLVAPDADPAVAATLGFVAGVALHRALRDLSPFRASGGSGLALKWPNDVLADDAKLAGILLEAQGTPGGGVKVIIGIGVNVVEAPKGLPYRATSLKELGASAGAADVLEAFSDSWVESYELWDNGRGVADVLELWRQSAAGVGGEVAVNRDGVVARGIFETIDDAGRLIIRANDNTRVAITAGDVHFGAAASTLR